MIRKKGITFCILIISLAGIVACSNQLQDRGDHHNNEEEVIEKQYKEEEIMKEFEQISKEDLNLDSIVSFMDKNIGRVSYKNAGIMVTTLEEAQKVFLRNLEDRFYTPETQEGLDKLFQVEMKLDCLADAAKGDLKELLEESTAKGYKLAAAEGAIFPIIDYDFYTKYSSFVDEELKAYIEVMAVHSKKLSAVDAALVIGWEELVQRAIQQEKFIEKYPDSDKIEAVKELSNWYRYYIFNGLPNTPLFSHKDDEMNPEAKSVYASYIQRESEGKLIEEIKEFMCLLEKNGYKGSKEVENFIEDVLQNN